MYRGDKWGVSVKHNTVKKGTCKGEISGEYLSGLNNKVNNGTCKGEISGEYLSNITLLKMEHVKAR